MIFKPCVVDRKHMILRNLVAYDLWSLQIPAKIDNWYLMIMVILSFYIIDRKIFYIGILDITGILSRKIYI